MILDSERLYTDAAYRDDARFRFLTDGFFAAEILGFRDFTERAHGPVFRKLYFAKNPNLPIREQHRKHKRIHFDPRHTFKTTAKRIDRVQWICAFPEEMTCLVESATQPLAQASAEKTAIVFHRPKNTPPRLFHLIWPELVVDKLPSCPWNIPGRRSIGAGDLDSTLDFTSPKSTQSGWHPLLIEPDDVEDVNNSGIGVSEDVRQHVIDVCDQNENLLREGGYINVSGTRYHPFDWYGKLLERAAENPDSWEVLVRCSLKLRDNARLMPGEFPDEDDCELQFPELPNLSYLELREKFYANYESFMGQQQNDPQGGAIMRFEERFYDTAQIQPARIPREGERFICWRPRYGAKKSMAKYSEGVCCQLLDGRIYVLDAWQGTYTASGEAEKIVFQCRHHDVETFLLMAVPGCDYVMNHVRNEAVKRNRSVRMQWIDWDEDDSRRAGECEQLEPLMKVGRLLFSTAMGNAAKCRKQFLSFGLVEENGIIECISKFAGLVPMSVMRANMQEYEIEGMRRRRDDAMMSQFLNQQGLDPMDDKLRVQTEAHMDALAKAVNRMPFAMPPLPGGLDG